MKEVQFPIPILVGVLTSSSYKESFYFLFSYEALASSTKRGDYHPLRIFQSAKTINSTIKWLQLIVGSSFPVV